jgi:tetratricopeptide (TPR) repeat protein
MIFLSFFVSMTSSQSALSMWNKALQLFPDEYYVLEMKAQVLLAMGELIPAVKAATRATELAPLWLGALLTLARIQRELGEAERALVSYERVMHLDPGNEEAATEYEEIKRVVDDIVRMKSRFEQSLGACAGKDDAEVVRCQMNLSSRARVITMK